MSEFSPKSSDSSSVLEASSSRRPPKRSCHSAPHTNIARLDRFFSISARGSSISTELFAGFVCFLANAYQLILVPEVMHNGGRGLGKPRYAFAFAVTTAVSSLLAGLLSNLPVPVGVGIGCTTYVAYTLVGDELPSTVIDTPEGRQAFASTACFISSLIMLVPALLTISWRTFKRIPASVKGAMPVGLGLLLALDGCQHIGLVVPTPATGVTHGPPLRFPVIAGGIVCILIAVLQSFAFRTAVIVPMLLATFVGWILHSAGMEEVEAPPPNFEGYVDAWSTYGHSTLDFSTVPLVGAAPIALATLSLSIIVLFDVGGITYALGSVAQLIENEGAREERLPGAHAVFVACAIGSLLSAFLGCAPVIVLGESFAGVMVGGRTGLTAICMGFCFLLAIPLAPIVEAVPVFASAPVLIMLGVHLLSLTKFLDLDDPIKALPSFCTIALMPFFYSISNAVIAGLLVHAALKLIIFLVNLLAPVHALLSCKQRARQDSTLSSTLDANPKRTSDGTASV